MGTRLGSTSLPVASGEGPLFRGTALARLRARERAQMTARAAIRRPPENPPRTPGGVYDRTPVVVAAGIPCRLMPAGDPAEALAADAVRATQRVIMAFPVGTDVRATDTLEVTHGIPGIPSPLTLAVIGPVVRSLETCRRVLAVWDPGAKSPGTESPG